MEPGERAPFITGEMISLDTYKMWLKKFDRDESIEKILD